MKQNNSYLRVGVLIGFGIVLINAVLVFSNLNANAHTTLSYLTVPVILGSTAYLAFALGKQMNKYGYVLLQSIKALYLGISIGLSSLWLLTWLRLDQVLEKPVYINLAGAGRPQRIESLISQYFTDAVSSVIVSTILTIIISSLSYWISNQRQKK